MDAIPVISQLKSAVQAIFGQLEEAEKTQINFSRQCPVVSQIRSAVEASLGDQEAARETQLECLGFICGVVDALPAVGHIKGGIHYAVGDNESGAIAMKAASRTTTVVTSGIIGFAVGGPVGAVVASTVSAPVYDSTVTIIDTVIHDKFCPFGVLIPFGDVKNAGKWYDMVCLITIDALTGHFIARIGTKIQGVKSGPVIAIEDPLGNGAKVFMKPSFVLQMKHLKTTMLMVQKAFSYFMNNGNMTKIKNIITNVMGKNFLTEDKFIGNGEDKLSVVFSKVGFKIMKGSDPILKNENNSVFLNQGSHWKPITMEKTYSIDENFVVKECEDKFLNDCMQTAITITDEKQLSRASSCDTIYEDCVDFLVGEELKDANGK